MRRVLLLLGLLGCGSGPKPAAPPDPTHGPDQQLVERCDACHADVAARWAMGSSHAALLDCQSCHQDTALRPGPRHVTTRACAGCHSAQAHNGFDCTACHDVHGSPNLFLVRESLAGQALHFTAAQGASADGLARFGVAGQQAGTGTCEVCHLTTKYYRASGGGQPHDATWCATCHTHENGFAPPAP